MSDEAISELHVALAKANAEITRLRAQVEMLERHKAETMAMLDKVLASWRSSNDKMTKVIHD